MQSLLAAVEKDCELEVLRKYREFAFMYLNFLNGLVNPTATMTEEQAAFVSDWIVDKHLPTEPDYPKLPELLPLATYINSCRT